MDILASSIPLNIDWQQILLHLFNFVVLAAGLYFLLYKPVKGFMDRRKAGYEETDKKAKESLAEAERKKKEYEELLSRADAEIEEKRLKADKAVQEANGALIASAQNKADEIVEKAKAAAAREHDAIVKKAEEDVADMVAQATEKLLMKSAESYDRFLTDAEEGEDEKEGEKRT